MRSKLLVRAPRLLSWVALLLVVAELLLFLLSWLLSAMMTEGVRSMLSSEGIRWFFGSFSEVVQTPLLVWLLLLSIAYGAVRKCGVLHFRTHVYRDRIALRLSVFLFIIYVAILALLIMSPHAVLLSADGALWPSAFSRGLVPAIAFGLLLFSVAYGLMAGTFRSLTDIFTSMTQGVAFSAPLLLLYVLAAQLYASLCFVF